MECHGNIKEWKCKKSFHKESTSKCNSGFLTRQSHRAGILLLYLIFGWPVLSIPYLFSTTFWWFKQHCAIGHSCAQMLPGSLYVLPFRLYCQPAYPPLMELLKSRYEQNLGGPAFVSACVPIRWERDDKNLSNACRSCHSMHNNPRLCDWRKNTQRQERRGCWKELFWW